jgi:Nif-specific regulatory protein
MIRTNPHVLKPVDSITSVSLPGTTTIANRYVLVKLLGQGGMGEVYHATDRLYRKDVALKVLTRLDPHSASHFDNEFLTLTKLRHPSLAEVYEMGDAPCGERRLRFFTMELVPGKPILEVVRSSQDVRLEAFNETVHQTLQALAYIHSRKIVHGDLKPCNILVHERDGHCSVKLIDFGLSLPIRRVWERQGVTGTVEYMAPERLRGEFPDRSSDIYALGVVLYEILAGRPLFSGTVSEIVRKHLEVLPPPMRALSSQVPPRLERMVTRMLEKHPSARYQSCEEILSDLGELFPANQTGLGGDGCDDHALNGRFVGRAEELDLLSNRMEQAEKNRQGTLVFVTGETGVGKTRLLREFRHWAQFHRYTHFGYNCYEDNATEYKPFLELLRQMVHHAQVHASDLITRYSPFIARWLPEFRSDLGYSNSAEASSYEKIWMLDAFVDFAVELADRSPYVMAIDDFQWADHGSREVLGFLARSLSSGRLLTIITLNTDSNFHREILSVFEGQQDTMVLSLSAFDRARTEEFVSSMFGDEEVPATWIDQLMTAVRGNPLFIEECIKSLANRGLIRRRRQRWEFDELAHEPLGVSSLDEVIAQRLRGRPPDTMALLEVFAVANRPLSVELLAKCCDLSRERLQESLVELRNDKILTQEWIDDRLKYSLYHGRVQRILYDRMETPGRRRTHVRLARSIEQLCREALDPEVEIYKNLEPLAYHYRLGGETEPAIRFGMAAAKKSMKVPAHRRAAELYEQVLATVGESADAHRWCGERLEAHEALGRLLQQEGRYDASLQNYRAVYERSASANDVERMARALERMGQIAAFRSEPAEAEKFLYPALALFEQLQDRAGQSDVLNHLGNAHANAGRYDRGLEYFERAMEIRSTLNDPVRLAGSCNNIAVIHAGQGRFEKALEYHRRALELRRSADVKTDVSISHLNLGSLFINRGDYEESLMHYEEALRVKREIGDLPGEALALRGLGVVHTNLGRHDDAQGYFEQALQIEHRIGNDLGKAFTHHYLAELDVIGARYDHAMQKYDLALRVFDRVTNDRFLAILHFRRGRLLLLLGDLPASVSLLEKSFRMLETMPGHPQKPEIQACLGYAYILQGRVDRGMALLEDAPAQAESTHSFWAICECKYLLALARLCRGEARECLTLCRDLIGLCERARNVEYRTRLLLLMTQALMRTPDSTEALACARKARSLVVGLGIWYHEMKVENFLAQLYLARGDRLRAVTHATHFQAAWERVLQHLPPDGAALYERARRDYDRIDVELYTNLITMDREAEMNPSSETDHRTLVRDALGMVDGGASHELQVFYEMTRSINSILELDPLLEAIMDLVVETVRAERGMIFLCEEGDLQVRVARNIGRETIRNVAEVSHSIIDHVLSTGQPVFSVDARDDDRFRDRQSVTRLEITSFMCIPLRIKDLSIGVVYVDNRGSVGRFDQHTLDFLTSFAHLAGIAIENARLHASLSRENEQLKEENIHLKEEITRTFGLETPIVGRSEAIEKVLGLIRVAARTASNVLLEGESGTGKELVARAIHYNSARKEAKFVPVNCGALTETLLESELFGHKRGAFSGAVSDKKGLFEEADGGTLFLDEITNTTRNMQSKLLRVLEDGEFRRVGDNQIRRADVRIVSATNLDLSEEIKAGHFREDLFYRLKVIHIKTPALRERPEDLPVLAHRFLEELNQRHGTNLRFAPPVIELLLEHDWPGNARELRNKIEQAYAMAEDAVIRVEHFPDLHALEKRAERSESGPLKNRINRIERRILIEELAGNQWNVQQTAHVLGLSRRALYDKMEKLNIKRPEVVGHSGE